MFAAFGIIGGLALGVTKVVDFIRNLPFFKGRWVGGWQWNAAAFIVGFAMCMGWQKNFAGDLMRMVPALAADADKVTGTAGYVLSGLLLGGLSGFGHELLDALSGVGTTLHNGSTTTHGAEV